MVGGNWYILLLLRVKIFRMNDFSNYGLNQEIVKAIAELGFETPTPIQEKTIPAITTSSSDLVALAQTGTGKTAGFGLPILQMIDTASKHVQSLILCPTRELCLQIANDITKFAKYIDNLQIVAVYGGTSIVPQIKQLKGAHIVVGTPGRVLDVIGRGALKINHIKWLVLDEADEMLNMGFKDDLDSILSSTPDNKQTLLFSATMPEGVREIAMNYMHDAEEISVGKRNSGAENVRHEYFMVKAADRYLALKRLADINPNIYGIVFCRTRSETKEVADKLIQDGYNADALHGDLSQAQRDSVMNRFRNKALQLLIATDVAARGLDVNELTHVINYNLPDDPEVYIHRSGRTGRAGKSGVSMTIIHSRELRKIKELEKLVGKQFDLKKVPNGTEICEKRLYALLDKIERVEVNEEEIANYIPQAIKKLSWLDKEELIKRFVSVEFNRFIEYYKTAEDLNVTPTQSKREDKKDKKGKENKNRRSAADFKRLFINIGTKRGITVPRLIGLINDSTKDKSIEIGRIDLQRNFSFFEIEVNAVEKVLNALQKATYNHESFEVNFANDFEKENKSTEKRMSEKRKGGNIKIEKRKFSGKNIDDFDFDFFNENRERRRKGKKSLPFEENNSPKYGAKDYVELINGFEQSEKRRKKNNTKTTKKEKKR